MSIALCVVAAFLIVSTLVSVGTINKPRKPLEPSTAVGVVVINSTLVIIIVLAAIRLWSA